MTCPHCQYSMPTSAKAQAHRDIKDATLHHADGMMVNGGSATAAAASGGVHDGYQQAGHEQQQQQQEVAAAAASGGGGGMDDAVEKPRQKRKRQSTKKGLMTATAEELAELDEGLSDDEPVSWRKSGNQRRAGTYIQHRAQQSVCFFSFLSYGGTYMHRCIRLSQEKDHQDKTRLTTNPKSLVYLFCTLQ